MKTRTLFPALILCVVSSRLVAQSVDPSTLVKALRDDWPTYSGDYTSRRYSSLSQVNQANVKNLTLAWSTRVTAGPGGGGGRGGGAVITGGEAAGDGSAAPAFGGGTTIKAAVLQVGGILYFSTPDNAWALDAHDGRELWHFYWKTRGGTHIGNRGLGMWHNWLYLETPDDYLVCLDARTGKERWHKTIADFGQQYFSTAAPIVVGNHIIVGTGNDLDAPGFLQSFDPETGERQWIFYCVPMEKGDRGVETWGTLDAARHGGGNPWIPGAYDPETKLYIFGTGNPSPAYTNNPGREGDNLFTCSLVAVDVETGKMKWFYQESPHDTHDWDSTETPLLVDGTFGGRPRKLVLHAARNGYFFVLDRVTGEHLLTSRMSESINWAKGLNDKGQPVRDPAKDATVPGSLVSTANHGTTNWPPPAYSPETGLIYVPVDESYAMYYLTETDPRGSMGLGGKDEINIGTLSSYLAAIDYKTGKVVWKRKYRSMGGERGNGMLTTAGKLLFAGDVSGNLIAYDPANGNALWHTYLGQVSNAPETYLLDGRQYLLVAAGDTLYAFTLL